MKSAKYITTISPLSKYLALSMLVIIPIIGFMIGRNYEREMTKLPTSSKPQNTESNQIVATDENSDIQKIARCGDYPQSLDTSGDKFRIVNGPSWSSDCRYIVWSIWMSGPGGLTQEQPSARKQTEGVFVFSERTGKVQKIYPRGSNNETPEFLGWKDNNVFLFKTMNGKFSYDLRDGVLKKEEQNK